MGGGVDIIRLLSDTDNGKFGKFSKSQKGSGPSAPFLTP